MSNVPRLTRMLVLVLSVILMFLLASIVVAQEKSSASEESDAGDAVTTNSLTVVDQPLGEGDTVAVSEVSAMNPGWVVIQRALAGVPGEVVGKAAVPAGISDDVVVVLSKEVLVGADLLAALHIDAGVEGVYEFPVGPDLAVLQDDEPVIEYFSITEAGEMVDEETASPEEEPAAEEEVVTPEEPAAQEEVAAPEEPAVEEDVVTPEEPAAQEEVAAPEEPAMEEDVVTPEEPAAQEEVAAPEEPAMEKDVVTPEEPAAQEEVAIPEEPTIEEEASTPEEPATGESSVAEEAPGNILDIAVSTEGIKMFVNAVGSSDLLKTLRGAGLYTVFAPNDGAFTELPEGALDELLADPEGKLNPVLNYHVVPGELRSSDMVDGAFANTLQGMAVQFSVDGDSIMVNDATIVEADIEAVNGIIHVIDKVLPPPSATDVASDEPDSGEGVEAEPGLEEPAEIPATGGSSSTNVIFVIMAIIALGWAGNIVVTRRHQLRESARAGRFA